DVMSIFNACPLNEFCASIDDRRPASQALARTMRRALSAVGMTQRQTKSTNDGGGIMRGKVGTAVTAGVALLLGMFVTADAASVRVRCETRGDRSKISVDGNDLAAGSYTATVTSPASAASGGVTALAKTAVGDEVEFDFDSNANDVAAGATSISPSFIQGNTVRGEIVGGGVSVSGTATCRVKN